ncbi:hypothetical protein AM588_10000246 [Phytophthora nicotianae]|uniref:Uncharacterized protein n=1 Tax=Phytophthora nicotianae TaxID=4792 RepID=A0A0W8CB69_PHYNI|nr:hypothetical protein AM588_10000246 [Phytophthora nicotianae]
MSHGRLCSYEKSAHSGNFGWSERPASKTRFAVYGHHFAEGLARSDDTVTRDQLDAGKVNAKTVLWKDFGVEFRENKTDYNNLFQEADESRALRALTLVIVPHNDARLYDMWKFVKANAKFYVSGQNSNESYDFCDDNLDAVYLKIYTRIKPKLTDFVNGGMYPEDEIDSLEISASRKAAPTNKPAKWQDQVLKTTNRMANLKLDHPPLLLPPQPALRRRKTKMKTSSLIVLQNFTN